MFIQGLNFQLPHNRSCLNQNPNETHTSLCLVDKSFMSVFIFRLSLHLYLFFSSLKFYVVACCLMTIPKVWILLFAYPQCSLRCSSILCIFSNIVFKPGSLIRFRLLLLTDIAALGVILSSFIRRLIMTNDAQEPRSCVYQVVQIGDIPFLLFFFYSLARMISMRNSSLIDWLLVVPNFHFKSKQKCFLLFT